MFSILGSSGFPIRLHFPDSRQVCAGVSKHPPTQAHAPHPTAWRASPTAPGAPGQESARTRPPAPPPAHSPNSYGWSKERVGARHAGACRSPAARGSREDALPARSDSSLRGLLLRQADVPRCLRKITTEKNQELNLSEILSLVPLETWLDRASALGSALFHHSDLYSNPGSPPATPGPRQFVSSGRWVTARVDGSLGSLASSFLLTKVIFSGLWLPYPGSGGLWNEGTRRLLQTRRLNPRGFPAGTGFSPTGSHRQTQQCC